MISKMFSDLLQSSCLIVYWIEKTYLFVCTNLLDSFLDCKRGDCYMNIV